MDISQGDERLSGLDNCLTQLTTTQNKTSTYLNKFKKKYS